MLTEEKFYELFAMRFAVWTLIATALCTYVLLVH